LAWLVSVFFCAQSVRKRKACFEFFERLLNDSFSSIPSWWGVAIHLPIRFRGGLESPIPHFGPRGGVLCCPPYQISL
jgi:hypothetical protein